MAKFGCTCLFVHLHIHRHIKPLHLHNLMYLQVSEGTVIYLQVISQIYGCSIYPQIHSFSRIIKDSELSIFMLTCFWYFYTTPGTFRCLKVLQMFCRQFKYVCMYFHVSADTFTYLKVFSHIPRYVCMSTGTFIYPKIFRFLQLL